MKRLDIFGKRFGRLLVVGEGPQNVYKGGYKKRTQICLCDCGKHTIVEVSSLTRKKGNTTSCGCYNLEINTKHGMSGGNLHRKESRFYNIYNGIKVRCNNIYAQNYKYYGGRGIKCEWEKFENFRDDVYESYLEHIEKYGKKETTIDRIDVNGNYCKKNCKWATRKEQRLNQR